MYGRGYNAGMKSLRNVSKKKAGYRASKDCGRIAVAFYLSNTKYAQDAFSSSSRVLAIDSIKRSMEVISKRASSLSRGSRIFEKPVERNSFVDACRELVREAESDEEKEYLMRLCAYTLMSEYGEGGHSIHFLGQE